MLSKEEIIAMNNTELGRKTASAVESDRQACSRMTEPGAPDQANSASDSSHFAAGQTAASSNSMTLARQARIRTCFISSEMPNDASSFNPAYKCGQTDQPLAKHLLESAIWAR
jgi:hypothetical protein